MSMSLIERLSGGELIALITAVAGLIFAVGLPIWLSYRKAELETRLKQEMLDCGMSADDIMKVLDAGKSE